MVCAGLSNNRDICVLKGGWKDVGLGCSIKKKGMWRLGLLMWLGRVERGQVSSW